MEEGQTPTVPMASASLNAEELRNCWIWQTDPCDPLLQMSLVALPALTFGHWSIV